MSLAPNLELVKHDVVALDNPRWGRFSIPFISTPDYVASATEDVWIIKDLLPVGGKLSFYAPAKTGKTFAALQLAAAIADPKESEFLDFPVHLHGRVLYLQVDMSANLWKTSYVKKLFMRDFDMTEVFHADRSMEDVPMPFNILGSGGIWLKNEIQRLKPLAVIIDTIRNTHLAKENDSTEMTMVVAATQAIVGDAAIVWIGHPRKASEFGSGDIIDDMRGSGAFNAAVDIIARLTKTKFTVKGRTDRGEDEPAKVQRDEDGFWELAERKGERQERTKTILESMPPGFTREDVLKRVQGELEIERATAQKLLKEIGFSIRKMKKSKGDV